MASPEAHEWFAGRISRSAAERLVSCHNLPAGTFLIRERETDQLEYALTIRDMSFERNPSIKHYKIQKLNDGCYFIATKVMFPSLEALVNFYSGYFLKVYTSFLYINIDRADGLCHRLTIPAPRMLPIRSDLSYETQNNWEIPKSVLEFIRILDNGHFGEVWYGRWDKKAEGIFKTLLQFKRSF